MKLLLLLLLAPVMMMAADKTATFKVSGNCNSCKKTIIKAANSVSGVQSSNWDKDTKIATVIYDEETDLASIKRAIVDAGYDVENIKATDEAYNKLHSCCKYRNKE